MTVLQSCFSNLHFFLLLLFALTLFCHRSCDFASARSSFSILFSIYHLFMFLHGFRYMWQCTLSISIRQTEKGWKRGKEGARAIQRERERKRVVNFHAYISCVRLVPLFFILFIRHAISWMYKLCIDLFVLCLYWFKCISVPFIFASNPLSYDCLSPC